MKIELTHGHFAVIDDGDFKKVSVHRWHTYINEKKNTFYAATNTVIDGKRTTLRMHRVIMDAKTGQIVDHIDMDGLNNRKGNLRFVDRRGNSANRKSYRGSSSKYKGVSRFRGNRWKAQINTGGKVRYLGCFIKEEHAARAYDAIAAEEFGEFARLNFPEEIWTQEQIDAVRRQFSSGFKKGNTIGPRFQKGNEYWKKGHEARYGGRNG